MHFEEGDDVEVAPNECSDLFVAARAREQP